jgi:molybdenum cofactor biosynthesis protein B
MSNEEHKQQAPKTLRCVIVTPTDSRDAASDASGDLMAELLTGAGHQVTGRHLLANDAAALDKLLRELGSDETVDVILCTGGTGLGPRDVTADTVQSLLTKHLPGFGELFRHLSYAEIGTSTILSRATGGAFGQKLLFSLPGSKKAVRLAIEKILIPELGHLMRELRGRK